MHRQPQSTPARGAQMNFPDPNSIRPPKPPERPLAPYMRYSRKMWAKVRQERSDAQLWEIGKIVGEMWRDATDSEKNIYQEEYERERVEYEKALKSYHNSHAYQQYLAAKNRAKHMEKASGSRRMDTGSGVVIQPIDEEDPFEITGKRLAAVRYDRNNRLIADLFSSAAVPDLRSVVAKNRIELLRKQANSLQIHQEKLNEELKRLEQGFLERKRTMEKSSETFAQQLKKVCESKPQVSEEKYKDMVKEWEGKLLTGYEEYKKKQDAIKAKLEEDRRQNPVLYQLMSENSPDPDPTSKQAQEESAPEESAQGSSQFLEQSYESETQSDAAEATTEHESKDTTIESVHAMETDQNDEKKET